MHETASTSSRSRMLPAFLVFALAAATVALGVTGALFSDSQAIGGNSFATGSGTLGTTAATLPFAVSNMAPGDTDGAHKVTVSNTGSLEYRHAITSTSTEDVLAGQLDLWVWDESTEDNTLLGGTAGTCDAVPADIGTFLYGPGAVGSTATTNLVGDRVLAAAASEVLCFYVEPTHRVGSSRHDVDGRLHFRHQGGRERHRRREPRPCRGHGRRGLPHPPPGGPPAAPAGGADGADVAAGGAGLVLAVVQARELLGGWRRRRRRPPRRRLAAAAGRLRVLGRPLARRPTTLLLAVSLVVGLSILTLSIEGIGRARAVLTDASAITGNAIATLDLVPPASVTATTTSYQDTSTQSNTTYYSVVHSTAAGWVSEDSVEASETTPGAICL